MHRRQLHSRGLRTGTRRDYLARLLKLFNGDVRLVAAAYLTGEKPILRAGLVYSNAGVYEYVTKVARLYREKRLKHHPD